MEWWLAATIILGSLLVLILSGFPIAFCFIALCMVGVYIFWGGEAGYSQYILSIKSSVTRFDLVPIVLFILMGAVMVEAGIGGNLVNSVNMWLGRLPGRLSLIAVIAGTIFATLSGSSMASTALLGSVLSPEMEKHGYKKSMSLGPILAGGSVAMLIPPSGLGVFIAVLAEVSVGQFLIGIIIPGLMLAFFFIAYIIIRCWLQPEIAPPYRSEQFTWSVKLKDLVKNLIPVVIVIFLVTGIIMLGLATPSEAAATGCLGAFIVAALYRKLTWNGVKRSTKTTVKFASMILLIMASGSAFTQVLAFSGVNQGMTAWILSLPVSPLMTVIGILVVCAIMGCFMPSMGIVMIIIPLLGPVVDALGMSMLWFSILVMVNCEMGAITPPFGTVLFVMKGVAPPNTTMGDVYKAAFPLACINVLTMLLMLFIPALTLWLPGVLFT